MSRENQIEEMPERNVKMFSSKEEYEHYRIKLIKREVAEEIFAEIEEKGKVDEPIVEYYILSYSELAELKKKYDTK